MHPLPDDAGGPSKPHRFSKAETQPTSIAASEVCQVGCEVLNLAKGYATNAVSRKFLEKVEGFVDRKARLFEGLEKYLPAPMPGVSRGPKRLRDKEYIWLTGWLETNGFGEWGKRPRTFAILYMMGCPEAVDGFVEQNLYDISIPYTEENLPRVIKGSKRREFIEYQHHVLTAHAKDLEEEGKHQNVDGSADSFFWTERELGSGGFGIVDHVISRQSYKPFARKRIPRGRTFKKDRDALRNFENELKNLKLLSHGHLVKLIGSYTDRKHVGLIMTPVADMDLDVYLSSTRIDPIDRQNCLRRFYGCLATAVEYLHHNQIRHMDIKPKNTLVKDRQILLTDFGTSHNWTDDSRSTTSGTNKQAFTKAYCAPEVLHGSRNRTSDIWSLGCVFFDMSTVLSGFSVSDRKSFHQSHGTNGLYIRDNEPAAKLWVDELKTQASRPEDNQILELILNMCNVNQDERPTATEVVSIILDFEGPPYYGYCCDRYDTHRSVDQDLDNTTAFDNDTTTARPGSSASNRDEPGRLLLGSEPSHKPPSVLEVEDGTTLQHLIPNEEAVISMQPSPEPSPTEHISKQLIHTDAVPDEGASAGNTTTQRESSDSSPESSPETPKQKPFSQFYFSPDVEDIDDGMTIQQIIPDLEGLRLGQMKPSDEKLKGASEPEDHSLVDEEKCRVTTVKVEHVSPTTPTILAPLENALNTTTRCPWPNCDFSVGPQNIQALRPHLRSMHGVHDLTWTALLPRDYITPACTADQFSLRLKSAIATKRQRLRQSSSASNSDQTAKSYSSRRKFVRFSGLPEEFRPSAVSPERDAETRSLDGSVKLDHLDNEQIEKLWRLSQEGQRPVDSESSVPNSSLVPSYFLASANLFSQQEADSMTRLPWYERFREKPLFVCGSLMFPSILKARAQVYMTSEGVYSQKLQRRLRTTATDWVKVNCSLQQAAESMTPAAISPFCISKMPGFGPAVLQRTSSGLMSRVYGFLIFGLSQDALACLDHMFSQENGDDMFTDTTRASWPQGLTFQRQAVTATVIVKEGWKKSIQAEAYVSGGPGYGYAYGFANLPEWNINRFVRGRSFRKLSSNQNGEATWVEEEEQLAEAMHLRFILHGDALCDAVVAEDKDKVLELIGNRVDVNAPCHVHGTSLQAAAFNGNEALVELLLREGARVNAKGGQYQNALIAATVKGHEKIARILLKNGADVLADGGRYISALYQAVDFSDLNLAKLLLEKGAWLSENYGELLDLASEHDSRGMGRLLEEYDVKMLHLQQRRSRDNNDDNNSEHTSHDDYETIISPVAASVLRRSHNGESAEDRVALNKTALIKQVGFKIMVLKGQKGKWTGIKGVQIFKAAIQAGMDESIVDKARPHLKLAQNVLDWLMKAVNEANAENVALERTRRRLVTDGTERGRSRGRRRRIGNGDNANDRGSQPVASDTSTTTMRRNTISDMPLPINPNYHSSSSSATPLLASSSLNLPQNIGRSPVVAASSSSDIICLTCNGRGGRLGTEHRCHICGGSGWPRRQSDGGSRVVTGGHDGAICTTCLGRGHVYSNRDTCRDCGGRGSIVDVADPMTRSVGVGGGGSQNDPPPPYSSAA
ncbi:hypothetical protein DV736_g2953, partial [Chaetothyriales sp. CBS 134916]